MDTKKSHSAPRRRVAALAATFALMIPGSAVAAGPDQDLDIVGFSATSPVTVNPPQLITLVLSVENHGTAAAPRNVLIEGRRIFGKGKVFNHVFPVEADPGAGPVAYELLLEDFAPEAGGIRWVATLKDGAPDDGDVATAITETIPAQGESKGGKDKVKVK